MHKPWEVENCDEIFAYHSIYPVPVAAALWCEIPPLEVDKYLKESFDVTPGVLQHPSIKCLEVKCRAIQNAIVAGVLPVSRENGQVVTEHVAPARRHVSRQHLKEWIAKEFPSSKPTFLFDEVERKTHSTINVESFQALQADLEASRSEIDRMRSRIKKITDERDGLIGENNSLKAMVEKNNALGTRSETTYLNIIGGILKLMLSRSPAGKPHSIFESQAAIISALLAHFPNTQGMSARTLEEKFASANQSIKST